MKLKDFMKLHAKEFDYDILLKRIDESGNIFYLDYANNYDAPYEKYFRDYFDWDVEYFKIEKDNNRHVLVIYISYYSLKIKQAYIKEYNKVATMSENVMCKK